MVDYPLRLLWNIPLRNSLRVVSTQSAYTTPSTINHPPSINPQPPPPPITTTLSTAFSYFSLFVFSSFSVLLCCCQAVFFSSSLAFSNLFVFCFFFSSFRFLASSLLSFSFVSFRFLFVFVVVLLCSSYSLCVRRILLIIIFCLLRQIVSIDTNRRNQSRVQQNSTC